MSGEIDIVATVRQISLTSLDTWYTAMALAAATALHAVATVPFAEAAATRILRGFGRSPRIGPGLSTSAADRPWILRSGILAPLMLGATGGILRMIKPSAAVDALSSSFDASVLSGGPFATAHTIVAVLVALSVATPTAIQLYRLASPSASLFLLPVHALGAACAAALGFILGPIALIPVLLAGGSTIEPLKSAEMFGKALTFHAELRRDEADLAEGDDVPS